MKAAELEADLARAEDQWEKDFYALPKCRCEAWSEIECGCGNYVEYAEYILRRRTEYMFKIIVGDES